MEDCGVAVVGLDEDELIEVELDRVLLAGDDRHRTAPVLLSALIHPEFEGALGEEKLHLAMGIRRGIFPQVRSARAEKAYF